MICDHLSSQMLRFIAFIVLYNNKIMENYGYFLLLMLTLIKNITRIGIYISRQIDSGSN